MIQTLTTQIEKYIGYKLSDKEIKKLEKILTNREHIEIKEYITSILVLARINFYVPKIMNYFVVSWEDADHVILSNKKVELKINIMDLVEKENKVKEFAETLMQFTDIYIRDFNKYAKHMIKELLDSIADEEEYKIVVKDGKVIVNDEYVINKELFDLQLIFLSLLTEGIDG
jgi:hypothetical protein